jgi:hypothetical protein
MKPEITITGKEGKELQIFLCRMFKLKRIPADSEAFFLAIRKKTRAEVVAIASDYFVLID